MVRFSALAVALAACSFRTNATTGDAPVAHDVIAIDLPVDVVIDSPPPNACMSASASCLDANTLETCTGPNAQPVVTTCSWGCLTPGTDHCGNFAPSGGAVIGGDLDGNGVGDVTLSNTIVNTDNGTILGTTSGFTHTLRNGVQVFKFRSLTMSGAIAFTGSNAVAFAASGSISVDATLDARGPCALSRSTPGPGGFAGGAADNAGLGTGGGGSLNGKNDGGGGAGHGAVGGAGDGGATGGTTTGNDLITVLVGGSGGGGGHNVGGGGGGGGAIQLVSNTSIVINSGGINAGGCGGHSTAGDGNGGGGGGGAGGAILLEAPTVRVSGSLAVNGGAGGGLTTDGGDASLDRIAATNGTGGGTGGAGATLIGGDAPSKGGGGGGAVGRIRIDTRSGQATVTGTLSPALADPNSTATQGTASVN